MLIPPLCAPEHPLAFNLFRTCLSIVSRHSVHSRYSSTQSAFAASCGLFFPRNAYDTPLLQCMRQAALASDPLAVTLMKQWDEEFTPDVLAQGTTIGELWNNEAAGIRDALRWGALRGHLQSVASVGAVLIPRGILLHCTATYSDFDGARVNSHFVRGP